MKKLILDNSKLWMEKIEKNVYLSVNSIRDDKNQKNKFIIIQKIFKYYTIWKNIFSKLTNDYEITPYCVKAQFKMKGSK